LTSPKVRNKLTSLHRYQNYFENSVDKKSAYHYTGCHRQWILVYSCKQIHQVCPCNFPKGHGRNFSHQNIHQNLHCKRYTMSN